MPNILESLAAQLAGPDLPAQEPAVRQSPTATRKQLQPAVDNSQAVEFGRGWRLRRRPAFPAGVWRLPWGKFGVPLYVEFVDHWYSREGSGLKPSWALLEYSATLPWWHFEHLRAAGDPTGAFDCPDCCYACGRRLFYRTQSGDELCALCHPLKSGQKIRGVFEAHYSNGEPDVEPPSLENVEFFLRPGNSCDHWGY